jgi:hypothetical protein
MSPSSFWWHCTLARVLALFALPRFSRRRGTATSILIGVSSTVARPAPASPKSASLQFPFRFDCYRTFDDGSVWARNSQLSSTDNPSSESPKRFEHPLWTRVSLGKELHLTPFGTPRQHG